MNAVMSHAALLAQQSEGNPLGLLILALPIAAIIFLTVVPQRKQRKQQAELMASLEVGDEVVTIGGILGEINAFEDDVVHLQVDTDVVIRVGRAAIARKVTEPEESTASRTRGDDTGTTED